MATLSTYKTLSGGAVQIVIPEPLSGDGGQALNDNFKSIADSVLSPGGSTGDLQYNDGSTLAGAGWTMVGTPGEERLLSPGTTDDGSTELQVTGAVVATAFYGSAAYMSDIPLPTLAQILEANPSTGGYTMELAGGSVDAQGGYFTVSGGYFDVAGGYIQDSATGLPIYQSGNLYCSSLYSQWIDLRGGDIYGNGGVGAGGGTWGMDGAYLYFDNDSYAWGDGTGNVNLYSTTFNAAGTITAYSANIEIGYITGGSGWAGTGLNLLAGSNQFSMVLSSTGIAYFGNTAAGATWLEVNSAAVSCPNKLLVGGASDEGSGFCATYAGGAIAITGSGAGFQTDDRTLGSSHAWQQYATGGTFHIWTKTYGDRVTIDISGDITAVGGIAAGGCLAVGQSSTASVIGNNSTILTDYIGVARVAPTSSVSGIILQADSSIKPGQHVVVVNESSYTITFAAASSSYVADGSSSPIGGKTARAFVWDSATSLWYRCA